jgi:hypothetical protein
MQEPVGYMADLVGDDGDYECYEFGDQMLGKE